MTFDGKETVCVIEWRDEPSDKIEYFAGNAPKLRNEVAVGYYMAMERNIHIGDTITIEYDKYADDRTTFHKTSEDFIVTAFVDRFGNNTPVAIMGDEFEGSLVTDSDYFSC